MSSGYRFGKYPKPELPEDGSPESMVCQGLGNSAEYFVILESLNCTSGELILTMIQGNYGIISRLGDRI